MGCLRCALHAAYDRLQAAAHAEHGQGGAHVGSQAMAHTEHGNVGAYAGSQGAARSIALVVHQEEASTVSAPRGQHARSVSATDRAPIARGASMLPPWTGGRGSCTQFFSRRGKRAAAMQGSGVATGAAEHAAAGLCVVGGLASVSGEQVASGVASSAGAGANVLGIVPAYARFNRGPYQFDEVIDISSGEEA